MILDINALSALAEGEPTAARLVAGSGQTAIPVIVLGEYRFGIGRSRHRKEYERWLEEIVSKCRVLAVDEETAVWYASLRRELKDAGTPIPTNDEWIAALCRQHALPVVSRDRHFDQVAGVQRIDW